MTFCEYETCPRWDFFCLFYILFSSLFAVTGNSGKKLQGWWVKSAAKYIHLMNSLFYSYLVLPDLQRNNHTCSRPNLCWSISWGGLCGYRHSVYSTNNLVRFIVHSCFISIVFISSVLVSLESMEQGRPQHSRCWLETLMSPLERPQSPVTGLQYCFYKL